MTGRVARLPIPRTRSLFETESNSAYQNGQKELHLVNLLAVEMESSSLRV